MIGLLPEVGQTRRTQDLPPVEDPPIELQPPEPPIPPEITTYPVDELAADKIRLGLDQTLGGLRSFEERAKELGESAKSKVLRLTPIQRIWGALSARNSYLDPKGPQWLKDLSLATNSFLESSAKDALKIGADVALDATIGGMYQGIRSLTGQLPRSEDILPGASAMASINPQYSEAYSNFDKSGFGKVFNDTYLVSLNTAQIGAMAQSLFGSRTVSTRGIGRNSITSKISTIPPRLSIPTIPQALKAAGWLSAWYYGQRTLGAFEKSARAAELSAGRKIDVPIVNTPPYPDIVIPPANPPPLQPITIVISPNEPKPIDDTPPETPIDWGKMFDSLRNTGSGGFIPVPIMVPSSPGSDQVQKEQYGGGSSRPANVGRRRSEVQGKKRKKKKPHLSPSDALSKPAQMARRAIQNG
jgi:hypothetical protein